MHVLFLIIKGEIGEKATTMITELIRDNRKIIDRIPRDDIDRIIELVKEYKVLKLEIQSLNFCLSGSVSQS